MAEFVYKSTTGHPIIVDNYIITPQPGLQSKYQIEVLDALMGSAINRYDDGVLATVDDGIPITASVSNSVYYININGTMIPLTEIPETINTNRTIAATDNGKVFNCTTALTITIPAALSPKPSFLINLPPTGSVAIAVTGGAQINADVNTLTRARANNTTGVAVVPYTESDGYGVSGS